MMIKESIALVIFLALVGLTLYLTLRKHLNTTLTAVLLVFSLLTGLAIANYDLIEKATGELPGLSLFRGQVNWIKDQALEDLQKEAELQRQSLKPLIADVNGTSQKIDAAIKYTEALLESLKRAEERLKKEEFALKEQSLKIGQATEQATALSRALSDLALLITRVTWLQLQARDESDVKRREAVTRQVMDQLDAIVDLVIEDPDARSEFVNSVMGSLPARR
jgi:chromosome segregation ATPase